MSIIWLSNLVEMLRDIVWLLGRRNNHVKLWTDDAFYYSNSYYQACYKRYLIANVISGDLSSTLPIHGSRLSVKKLGINISLSSLEGRRADNMTHIWPERILGERGIGGNKLDYQDLWCLVDDKAQLLADIYEKDERKL